MASGGPGDNPFKDIVVFKLKYNIYGATCDALIKELAQYISWHEIEEKTMGVNNTPSNPNLLKKLEERLKHLIKEEKKKFK